MKLLFSFCLGSFCTMHREVFGEMTPTHCIGIIAGYLAAYRRQVLQMHAVSCSGLDMIPGMPKTKHNTYPVREQTHGQCRGCNNANASLLKVWGDCVQRVILECGMAVRQDHFHSTLWHSAIAILDQTRSIGAGKQAKGMDCHLSRQVKGTAGMATGFSGHAQAHGF